jgi:hypothetical protein
MKPRDYCCCAIPLVNAGIYLTVLVQFVVALLAGVLSLVTPSCKFVSEYEDAQLTLSSGRRSNAIVCPLDLCRHLLCRGCDSSSGHYRCEISSVTRSYLSSLMLTRHRKKLRCFGAT